MLLDKPITITANGEVWRPENYGGKFYGPLTLRTGIEKSRNVMTVRLVFIGYDKPRPMGKGQTGGVLAAPIFTEFMKVALKDAPPKEFPVPPGIELIPIDRRTGVRAREGGGKNVILDHLSRNGTRFRHLEHRLPQSSPPASPQDCRYCRG